MTRGLFVGLLLCLAAAGLAQEPARRPAVVEAGSGLWFFAEEAALRAELAEEFGVRVPTGTVVYGRLLRREPQGRRSLLVFGHAGDRAGARALLDAAKADPVDKPDLLYLIEEGGVFGVVGYYPEDGKGGFLPEGHWSPPQARTEAWPRGSAHGPIRECLPCRGWLCTGQALACFADLDGEGREEVLFTGREGEFRGIRIFAVEPERGLRMVFAEPQVNGRWQRRGKDWVLVGAVTCEGGDYCGLGNPRCTRPKVYAFSAGKFEPDAALADRYYPVRTKTAPKKCPVDAPLLVWGPDERFYRFLPRPARD